MKTLTKAALIVLALSTAACTRPDRFGTGADGAGAGAGYGADGSISDPTSPAYFNQTIGDRVLFQVDQSTLTPEAMSVLDGQARWLLDNSQYMALIEGHADEQGTREYNLALGARRAAAVQQFLMAQGVAPDRMKTISYGKERPIEVCSEEACYSRNRRAVTVLSMGSGV